MPPTVAPSPPLFDRPPLDRPSLARRLPPDLAGQRLDQALAELLPEFSRSRLQQWIDAGRVRLNGLPCRRRDRVWGGEEVWVEPVLEPDVNCLPQAIPLDLVYEDEDLLVVNKPAGLVVHPAAGNLDGTLQNALLHRAPELAQLPRGGLVHRLDKDTSGLLVVARTLLAHKSLVEQLQAREVHREYRALVTGVPLGGGRIDAPLGRHPRLRTQMAVVPGGRPAVTHYRVLEDFAAHALLGLRLETGRTHQIRVHLAHIRFPILGDPVYGGRPRPPKGASSRLVTALRAFPRQALHAIRLGLRHPRTGAEMNWEVPLAPDMVALLVLLRAEASVDERR
ncbi:MAG: 23S rRNA pseudouridine(1911/1915/1917) synthase RluD [Chromatiaceae bacterium]|nr:23S rRNA pseudouridine(1911/1915/1917) synthase RluD [Candidatus Thioaporhodococcus sediminis]